MPGAAELFRSTHPSDRDQTGSDRTGDDRTGGERPKAPPQQHRPAEESPPRPAPSAAPAESPAPVSRAGRRGSGRVRHDEKITVYVSGDELLALEQARLTLRAEHGMAVDRGRIVREAIAAVIAELAERGSDSELVRRLSQS
nr:hypothetical protein [Microlunatus panaciterrae]